MLQLFYNWAIFYNLFFTTKPWFHNRRYVERYICRYKENSDHQSCFPIIGYISSQVNSLQGAGKLLAKSLPQSLAKVLARFLASFLARSLASSLARFLARCHPKCLAMFLAMSLAMFLTRFPKYVSG